MKTETSIDFSDKKILEKYSSTFTLSDMEVFVFPDLLYPLVIANIMSPVIWKWRDDPWFENIEKKSFTYKANRIKQYIIQNYIFNLDLSTWGLTTKQREIERFRDFIDMEMLKHSNGLFGYEGDKYYFDIDIRKHFGLDKYDSDVIPYWKTETVEAMEAFRHKPGFTTGAGECVSLSALYAAAMFIVGRIPLKKIFMIATPLHSQNFIIEKEGLLTNNRRILTKNMWFNGTSLSVKARRALENEKVTIVSHISGYIHLLFNNATIDPDAYNNFSVKLREFLKADLTKSLFINFLRFKSKYKSLFQLRCDCHGYSKYIMLEKMFEYEHNSSFNAGPETRRLLLDEMDGDEFHLSPAPDKLFINDFEGILDQNGNKPLEVIEKEFLNIVDDSYAQKIKEMMQDIRHFLVTEPQLPDKDKIFSKLNVLNISTVNSREEIIHNVRMQAGGSELCMLALYVYRQMDTINWLPFIKAAMERNPVSFDELGKYSAGEIYDMLLAMPADSIYGGKRLAMPDEVWNYRRGDGIEKSILLADIILENDKDAEITITVNEKSAVLFYDKKSYHFDSAKGLKKNISISGRNYLVH